MSRSLRILSILTLSVVSAAIASASTWGGHHGTIHLSFSEGPKFEHVMKSEPLPELGLVVDLYAVLTDIQPIIYNHGKYLSVGGYELQLKVEGAEWEILATDLPDQSINVGMNKGCLYVGKFTGIKFIDGNATLVHWSIRLPGEPENVVFSLDPAGLNSCEVLIGCPDSGTQALWTGSGAAKMLGVVFSAGYIPAYLNWNGEEPDLTPVRGEVDWQDTGLFALE
ncbi:hypothetical protein KKG45_14035 [bacterium]|nr:hypothetical protein [bacterium]MBU1074358.1 hypothetical protein [bacterium]